MLSRSRQSCICKPLWSMPCDKMGVTGLWNKKCMKPLTTIILTLLTLTSFGQDNNSVASTNYTFVSEPMPSYPGGHAEMIKFINKHLKYPTDSRTVQGKVYVEFI